jgi:hypothetical protein
MPIKPPVVFLLVPHGMDGLLRSFTYINQLMQKLLSHKQDGFLRTIPALGFV